MKTHSKENRVNEHLTPTGYHSLEDRKSTGAHYTPSSLAIFVARQIVEAWFQDPSHESVRILDPASGDGELLISILSELSRRGFPDSDIEVHGFDTDPAAVSFATSRLKELFPNISVSIKCESFLDFVLLNGSGPIFRLSDSNLFDLVISNPPYVRTQVLGAKKAQKLARQFGLSGRVDLYHAFILGIAEIMRPGGIAGIIVSNRFMTTKAGARVREGITETFNVLHVWDLGDTRLFEAAVLPAVLLVRKKDSKTNLPRSRFTSIYSTESDSPDQVFTNVMDSLASHGCVQVEGGQVFYVQQGYLEYGDKPSGVWRISNETLDNWLKRVSVNTFCTFSDIGKIRVGVKTTADRVFIRSDWDKMSDAERPEILRPLITHHIASRYKSTPEFPKKKILYTHEVVNGKRVAINIKKYPRAAQYLERHRSILEERKYLTKSGRNWYEIWVPQDPDAWLLPKIVFRDISKAPTFWMDLSGAVVNGDCYWLACDDPKKINLLWLALAVGNSSFIKTFYDRRFHNKLYASRRRFMTQYVEKFPLPDPKSELAKEIVSSAKEIYELSPSPRTIELEEKLNTLVWKSFGFSLEEVPG